MKPVNAILVSAACLTLGACSFSINESDYRHDNASDYVTVTLPSGERNTIRCPEGTHSFVISSDHGSDLAYGCRTIGAPLPILSE